MVSKKLLLVGGLAAAIMGVLAFGRKANAAPAEDDDDDVSFPPSPELDEPDEIPEILPLPDGGSVEDVLRGGVKRGEEILEEAKDRIIVDDGAVVSPGIPQPLPAPAPAPKRPKTPKAPAPKLPAPLPIPSEIPDFTTQPLPGGIDIPTPIKKLPPPDLGPGEEVKLPPSPALKPETEAMLRVLLAKEASVNWKAEEPTVKAWQLQRGLSGDGKFGPGSAKKLAAETGLLPIVRFWPKGTLPGKAVPDFQSELMLIASKANEPRKTHLLAAAQREQGQGFGTPPKPITQRIEI